MVIKDRKPPPSSELRAKILHASQQIVAEHGYSALTMRRVAKVIDYSPTTIYLYFKNREAIVAELGRIGLNHLAEQLASVATIKNPLKRLEQYASYYIRFSEEYGEAYRLIFMESSNLADAIFRSAKGKGATNAGTKAFGFFVQAFADLADQNSKWGKRAPVKNAEVVWAALHGIAALKLTCGKFLQTDSKSLVQLAIPALLAGLAGKA